MAITEDTAGGAPGGSQEFFTQNAGQNVPPPGSAPGGQHTPPPGPTGLDLQATLMVLGSFGTSPQHKKYLEEIMDDAVKQIPDLKQIPLQAPQGAQAFVTTVNGAQFAFILGFADLIPPAQDYRPVSDRFRDAQDVLRKTVGQNVNIVGSQLVSDRDLDRSQNMRLAIVSALLSTARADIREANSRALSSGLDWVVDANVDSAVDFINRMSPVKTLPRADFGFVLGVRQQGRNNPYMNGFNQQQQNIPVDPMIACVGYTEVIGPIPDRNSGISKFLPIVHITATVSRIPTLAAELLALTQMAQMAVVNQGWKLPFKKFQEGKPNLGNLRLSPNPNEPNKLWFIDNPDLFERFIAEQFYPPVIYMDVQEGAYRIPSRVLFAGDRPEYLGRIANEASRFFGQPFMGLKGPLPLSMTVAQEYTGTIGTDVKQDSREITYLNRVCQGALDKPSADILLNYQNDPSERARVVSHLTNSFTSLYRNRLAWISPEFITHLSGMIRGSSLRIYDPTAQAGTVPLAGYIQAGTDFTGFQSFAYQRQGGIQDGLGNYFI